MNEKAMKDRTKALALRILTLVDSLPKTTTGNVIGAQLVRCGTSVAANYRAACRARSKAEFIAKLGIVEEESDECAFWLEIIVESGLIKEKRILPLLDETNQLLKIVSSSRITAKKNLRGISVRRGSEKIEIRKSKIENK